MYNKVVALKTLYLFAKDYFYLDGGRHLKGVFYLGGILPGCILPKGYLICGGYVIKKKVRHLWEGKLTSFRIGGTS